MLTICVCAFVCECSCIKCVYVFVERGCAPVCVCASVCECVRRLLLYVRALLVLCKSGI